MIIDIEGLGHVLCLTTAILNFSLDRNLDCGTVRRKPSMAHSDEASSPSSAPPRSLYIVTVNEQFIVVFRIRSVSKNAKGIKEQRKGLVAPLQQLRMVLDDVRSTIFTKSLNILPMQIHPSSPPQQQVGNIQSPK